MNNYDLNWMFETIETIKGHEFFYKLLCFLTFRAKRKMKYSDLFLIYYGIHKRKFGDKKAKERAFDSIVKIYTENNGKKPDMI